MYLSNYDITQKLTSYFNVIINPEKTSYSQLREYITSSKPINLIQEKVEAELRTLMQLDKEEARINLEKQFLARQSEEDRQENYNDEQLENKLNNKTKNLRDKLDKNLIAETLLVIELNRLRSLPIVHAHPSNNTHAHPSNNTHAHPSNNTHAHPSNNTHAHPSNNTHAHPSNNTHAHPSNNTHAHPSNNTHAHPSNNTHAHPSNNTHAHPSNNSHNHPHPNIALIANIELSLFENRTGTARIRGMLDDIDIQLKVLKTKQRERDARLKARVDLAEQKAGTKIDDVLSSSNQIKLTNTINARHSDLSEQCRSLIQKTKEAHYSLFIQQLEQSLKHSSYSEEEKNGLQITLNYMKQHRIHLEKSKELQAELNQTKNSIASYETRLENSKNRINTINQMNPDLTNENTKLAANNIHLQEEKSQNNSKYASFNKSSLIFTGITITLALVAGFAIIFNAPITLLIACATVSGIALLSSIALGITSWVYKNREQKIDLIIECNEETIKKNNKQMSNQLIELSELKDKTIPECEKTIPILKQKRLKQEQLLEENNAKVQQILEKAKATEPTAENPSLFLSSILASGSDVNPNHFLSNKNKGQRKDNDSTLERESSYSMA